MSVIKHNCADNASNNEQWKRAVNSSTNQIHESQLKLKSIQTLTEATAWSANVRQVNEQHDDDDD